MVSSLEETGKQRKTQKENPLQRRKKCPSENRKEDIRRDLQVWLRKLKPKERTLQEGKITGKGESKIKETKTKIKGRELGKEKKRKDIKGKEREKEEVRGKE